MTDLSQEMAKSESEKITIHWDGMGYTVGTGVATAQKIVQRSTPFPTGISLYGREGLGNLT